MTYHVLHEHELRYESNFLTIIVSISERGDSERENVRSLLEKLDEQIKEFFTQGI